MFWKYLYKCHPYLAVFAVLGYIGRIQQKLKKGKRNKKGIIRTCLCTKKQKILTIFLSWQ